MNEQEQIVSTLTFCKRLGKLTVGFDVVKAAMQQGNAALVLTAKDLSAKTNKEVCYLCNAMDIPRRTIDITLDELWYLIRKRAGVIAVCDEGFAQKLQSLLDTQSKQSET